MEYFVREILVEDYLDSPQEGDIATMDHKDLDETTLLDMLDYLSTFLNVAPGNQDDVRLGSATSPPGPDNRQPPPCRDNS